MRRGATYEQIKEFVEDNGYKLISKEYRSCKEKIEVECPFGHRYFVTWGNFKHGNRCPICSKEINRNKRTTPYGEVKEIAESRGYELLSKEYIPKKKILLKCSKGHIWEVDFRSFKSGVNCAYCNGHIKFTYDFVKQDIENRGYILLSKEYINNIQKLDLICPRGHSIKMSYGSLRNGCDCNICSSQRCGDKQRFSYEYVKQYVEEKGFILMSKEYKRAREKIDIKCCVCGYEFSPTFDNFKNKNTGCPSCLGTKKYEYDDVKDFINNFNFELLSNKYNNCREKLKIKCPEGHIFKMNFDTFKNKRCRCPICNESKGERRISDYLDKNNIKYEIQKTYNDLLGLGNGHLSYDFYLPDYNLLIEYQGGFHDGSVTGSYQRYYDLEKQQEHDKRKREYAEKNNYRLLEIWYWDFDRIEEILKEEIK